MSNRRPKAQQLAPWSSAFVGQLDWHALGEDPIGEIQIFADATNAPELQERLDERIAHEVNAVLATTQDFDAYDVIELLRLRELPVTPVAGLANGHDGSAAAVDLISLVMLARGSRMLSRRPRNETQPHLVINELHERAKRLLRLAIYMQTAKAALASEDPLARLASEYQSYLVSVRGLQYESVQSEHDSALFDRPELDRILKEALGFSYQDFVSARQAIHGRYARILTGLRDTTGEIVMRAEAERREPTQDEIEVFRESMLAFLFLPAERASFTANDIASEAAIEIQAAKAVLETFSLEFDGNQDAVSTVRNFLRGANPLARTGLVVDEDGNYLIAGDQIGADSFRMVVEPILKGTKAWSRYDRIRSGASESLAVGALERVLQTPATHTNLKYLAPKGGMTPDALSADCLAPREIGDQTECDALFVIEDVAICLEVKGRTIADPARRGDTARLKTEIGNIFGEGARQARRLEALISTNGGIWLQDGTWLDLGGVREIRTIVVGLDIFGPLAVALGDLHRTGLLGTGSLPWITSLHDLDVISKILDRPAEFLLYLRRRADSGVATYYRGADELDLFMLFLDGGLYVEPDPDVVGRDYPTTRRRNYDRRRHERDSRPTIVGTHTDALDAWIYWIEGSSPYEVDKPIFNTHPSVQNIVDLLANSREPGWFRFGSDLLGLEGRAQKRIGRFFRQLVRQTRQDRRGHSMVQRFAGLWGSPTLFAATRPSGEAHEVTTEKLRAYMTAKKHQLQSDRSLGIVIGPNHEFEHVIYLNDVPGDNPELDELGEALGLLSVEESRKQAPPNAGPKRRKARRPKKKKK